MVLRKLSQTFKITLALMLSVLVSGLPSAYAYAVPPVDNEVVSNGQETCPGTTFTEEAGGWVKYDGLTEITFEVPQKTGFTVTEICYKSSTTVVYPEVSGTVTSTVTNKNGNVQALSHVSVYYTKDVVTPTGSLSVSTDCEEITFGAIEFTPEDATVTFTLDGDATAAGTHTVAAGSHTVVMFVNGTEVDSETVEVSECEEEKKTDLCHATHSETNPFELINVSVSAAYHGHLGDGNGDHQDGEDIIPPFEYQGETYSQNWDAEGQAIYRAGCEVEEEEPEANISAAVVCVQGGVKVTLVNSGDADGSATVNGDTVEVPANDTVEVTLSFDLGTPFMTDVTVTVGETTLIDQVINCTPGQGGGQTLGTSTTTPAVLPATLPSTGGEQSPLMIVLASIIAYGAAYFLQGRRLLGRKEALEA